VHWEHTRKNRKKRDRIDTEKHFSLKLAALKYQITG